MAEQNKISFSSDYTKGAHPKILERLIETNMEQQDGYGTDKYCKSAAEKIKKACDCPDADVFFLAGGTQTNQTIIDMLLEPYEGVVAARTGHVAAHEAGAIEFSGHKVLTLPEEAGKINATDLKVLLMDFYEDGNHEHMVFPGAVYISFPTEYGTLYSKAELTAISEVCEEFEIPLFIDGARMGYGLMSKEADVTLSDIAGLCDVFYIGGTKVGALFGEAVVFTKGAPTRHPIPIIKQHGALLAKGWLLGLQFDTLFTDDLYFKISKNAIDMAEILKDNLVKRGYKIYIDSPTNQQFIVLENEKLKELSKHVGYGFWEKVDEDHTAIRLATDWATTEADIEELMKYLPGK
ncbi:threonine aldolase family protein [Butyrivibrio sp. AE2032]|uniref:threonine aldolase family protein n=1 Tax=Butyrivibrio sp. AE2032 TaxID=1458463 RepID=UPI0005564EE5|nr:aminotransferase class I/II-fold pyridoxal phosphate-dependent enzyme [Butyrivibrio sp. AE2032]